MAFGAVLDSSRAMLCFLGDASGFFRDVPSILKDVAGFFEEVFGFFVIDSVVRGAELGVWEFANAYR